MSEIIKTDSMQQTPENLSEELFVKLSRLVWQYRKAFNDSNDGFDLSPNELGLMMIMYQDPTINTANQIVKELGTTKGLASRNVDSLVKKGLIKTEQDEKDRRVVRLTLCTRAKELCEEARVRQQEFYHKAMNGICEKEARQALDVVEKMVFNIL